MVAASGEAAFFRASLAFERGVQRVVVRPDAMPDSWLNELAARAATLSGELFVRDDERYIRFRSRERLEVGAPAAESFTLARIEVPGDAGPAMPRVEVPSGERALRCEELAFAIGLKPVLYLVVPRADVERLVARYGHSTIVERADHIALDQHSGERTYGVGEQVVHLFIGEEAARAGALWDDGGSSRHIDELGALMGYPPCCVRAFHAMANRRINAAFPYVTAARTAALGGRFDPLLDVTSTRLVPFVPCTYGCEAAIEWARRVAHAAAIERRGRVVLYFDEARSIAFEHATIDGAHVTYRGARWASPNDDPRSEVLRRVYGATFGDDGSFTMTDAAIVLANGTSIPRDGGLGVVLPFVERPEP